MKRQLKIFAICTLLGIVLLGSGRSNGSTEPFQHNSSGQVAIRTQAAISYYVAAHLAEQVSFGAAQDLIVEFQKLSFGGWTNARFVIPETTRSTPREYLISARKLIEQRQGAFRVDDFWTMAMTAPDQLRQCLAWSIFQYIPSVLVVQTVLSSTTTC